MRGLLIRARIGLRSGAGPALICGTPSISVESTVNGRQRATKIVFGVKQFVSVGSIPIIAQAKVMISALTVIATSMMILINAMMVITASMIVAFKAMMVRA